MQPSGETMKRLNLVLLAPYVNRDDVGECWSTYQWVAGLSRQHDVTLLCQRRRDQSPIAPTLPETNVIEWQDPPLLRRFERLDSMAKPGLVPYMIRARRWLKRRNNQGRPVDLVHQLSPLAMRYPSPALRTGIPYVIGPLAGSLPTPGGFEREMSRGPWYMRLRSLDRLRFANDPLLRASYANAECVIGVAPYVREQLRDIELKRFEIASETGVLDLQMPSVRSDTGALRLLFVGRVVRSKGLRDLIRGLKLAVDVNAVLDVVGEGNDMAACVTEARSLGDRVKFHGKLPRADLARFYASADVFVFPSFREPSGNVVLEAMSHGLPLVVADNGGPGFAVDDSCGIRVPVASPEQFAHQIAEAIRKMRDPQLRKRLGDASYAKTVQRFHWGTKIAWMCSLYESILDEMRTRSLATPAQNPCAGGCINGWSLGAVDATATGIYRT